MKTFAVFAVNCPDGAFGIRPTPPRAGQRAPAAGSLGVMFQGGAHAFVKSLDIDRFLAALAIAQATPDPRGRIFREILRDIRRRPVVLCLVDQAALREPQIPGPFQEPCGDGFTL